MNRDDAVWNYFWAMHSALKANGDHLDDIDDPYWRGVLKRAMPAFEKACAAIEVDYPADVEPPSQDELDSMSAMDLWHYENSVGM